MCKNNIITTIMMNIITVMSGESDWSKSVGYSGITHLLFVAS